MVSILATIRRRNREAFINARPERVIPDRKKFASFKGQQPQVYMAGMNDDIFLAISVLWSRPLLSGGMGRPVFRRHCGCLFKIIYSDSGSYSNSDHFI